MARDRRAEEKRLSSVVDSLCTPEGGLIGPARRGHEQPLPSRNTILRIVEDIRSILFPGYFGISEIGTGSMRYHVGGTLDRVQREMREQIKRGVCFVCEKDPEECTVCEDRSLAMIRTFVRRRPGRHESGRSDLLLPRHAGDNELPYGARASSARRPADPADYHGTCPQPHRYRYPSRRPNQREFLHRPWNRSRDRGNLHYREEGAPLPGGDPRCEELPPGRARKTYQGNRPAPGGRGRRDHLLRRDHPRPRNHRERRRHRRQHLVGGGCSPKQPDRPGRGSSESSRR